MLPFSKSRYRIRNSLDSAIKSPLFYYTSYSARAGKFNETSIDQDKVAISTQVRWFILDS
ncbi:hypothetical protein STO1_006030 [Streptococcus oralis subsp. tigurinus]|uniref:Uncharacterized protein n=1 Tax=Streptococcus oralis subsp. tigurinus TaxID=1077464 RepID=A0A223ZT51_STROR|nr:hypothetical protein STO1_006030 [Streptococcus oralis subsp. tigurinus]